MLGAIRWRPLKKVQKMCKKHVLKMCSLGGQVQSQVLKMRKKCANNVAITTRTTTTTATII